MTDKDLDEDNEADLYRLFIGDVIGIENRLYIVTGFHPHGIPTLLEIKPDKES